MSINKKFSGILYHYRDEHGLTQRQMSELCDVSLRHYQDLEIGRSVPTLHNAVRISKILEFSLDELKNENDEENTNALSL